MASAAEYFEKRVPAAWNDRLTAQIERGADGSELLAKMRASSFALEVEVGSGGRFHLLVDGGAMRATASAAADPLVTLALSEADCARLEATVGPSPMNLLGGIGGQPDFILTPARIAGLREIEGTMRIEVTGRESWGVVLHFGAPPVPAPTTTVSIGDAEFAQLLAGELDLQGAFMTGKLQLGGDVEVPMKMAMAIMAPE
jgi:putative sterol carrier protein